MNIRASPKINNQFTTLNLKQRKKEGLLCQVQIQYQLTI